jgi:hypothetical protein
MKANNLLDIIGNVDDSIIEEAKQRKKAVVPRWIKWIATAACLCLVLGGAFNTLYRFGYFRSGCSSLPGDIVDGYYYYYYPHSGVWRYSDGKAKKLISAYWMRGYDVNENGLYYDDYSANLYRMDLKTLKKKKIYSASDATNIDFSAKDDGTVIVTVYNSKKRYQYDVLIDGKTGEVLEQLTDRIPYDTPFTNESDTKMRYTIGEREIVLVPIDRAEDGMYMPTENGKALLPQGRWVYDYIYDMSDDVKAFGVNNDIDNVESEMLMIFANGKTDLRPKEDYVYGHYPTEHICLYVGRDQSTIWCYDYTSDEKWQLKIDTEHSFYSIVNDDEMLYSCEPWNDDQAAWKIIYEGNRPAALQLIDDKITD